MTPDEQWTIECPPTTPEFPKPFGRYELLDRIGAGGMGSVYRARAVVGGPTVALKTPLTELLGFSAVRERFYREYQALARFRHPGFAPVLDFGQHEDAYYFTMAFVEGVPLSAVSPVDPVTARRIAIAVADAIQHAHDQGIVHRDLKPANIVIRPDGSAVVVDFGIALILDADAESRLTVGGTTIGTRPFMPPEQITGDVRAMGPHSDIYSLGVILYWMLTGQLPFEGRGQELVSQILSLPPTPPEDLVPHLDSRLSRAALRAIEKNPSDRFPSMSAFAEVLNAIDAAMPSTAGSVTAVRYEFVSQGSVAPAEIRGRLYLDVGNDLRPHVLDHHHEGGIARSATRLVTLRPELVLPAAETSDGSVTIVLHDHPDLDCVAASYLAGGLLRDGKLPSKADALAEYLDRVDSGAPMFNFRRPYTLYAAYMVLTRRLASSVPDPASRWEALVRGGQRLISFVLDSAGNKPLDQVNAFECSVMTRVDRLEITEDAQRYERKLHDPLTHARRAELQLPTPWGERVAVQALLVRDVQTEGDPERCIFFKDWARTDADRCPSSSGFEVLCVWMSHPHPRCIISVRPDSDGRLTGLGEILDAAETRARMGIGRERVSPPRPGYDNSDPWYDGRSHHDTIIDSPREGTMLTVQDVEHILLEFGSGTAISLD